MKSRRQKSRVTQIDQRLSLVSITYHKVLSSYVCSSCCYNLLHKGDLSHKSHLTCIQTIPCFRSHDIDRLAVAHNIASDRDWSFHLKKWAEWQSWSAIEIYQNLLHAVLHPQQRHHVYLLTRKEHQSLQLLHYIPYRFLLYFCLYFLPFLILNLLEAYFPFLIFLNLKIEKH